MKDYTEQELRTIAPMPTEIHEHVAYCLKKLFADKEHQIHEEIVHSLTYEEVLGVLLEMETYLSLCEEYEQLPQETREEYPFSFWVYCREQPQDTPKWKRKYKPFLATNIHTEMRVIE